MSSKSNALRAGLAAVGLIAFTASGAFAAPDPAPGHQQSCFFINEWQGWKSPNPHVLYLRVNMHDVYRVDLGAGSSQLQWPDMHLVSISRGGDSVCSALDLDLSVSDGHGMREHLFATGLTKLTPEEIAAIPKKDLP
jgi:hypothetical protein